MERLRAGDPLEESTDLPPMISSGEAGCVADWVAEARAGGAEVLAGGGGDGSFHEATVLASVPHDARCWQDEVFGPVVTVDRYADLDEGVRLANGTRYGGGAGDSGYGREGVMSAMKEMTEPRLLVVSVPAAI